MIKYRSYSLSNFRSVPQIDRLSEEQMFTIEVVGRVLPFKASSYVIDELIDWGPLRAYQQVSGACRTVRVPSVSSGPGKIRIVGVSEINGEKVFVLNFIQGRNPDWTNRPFFCQVRSGCHLDKRFKTGFRRGSVFLRRGVGFDE